MDPRPDNRRLVFGVELFEPLFDSNDVFAGVKPIPLSPEIFISKRFLGDILWDELVWDDFDGVFGFVGVRPTEALLGDLVGVRRLYSCDCVGVGVAVWPDWWCWDRAVIVAVDIDEGENVELWFNDCSLSLALLLFCTDFLGDLLSATSVLFLGIFGTTFLPLLRMTSSSGFRLGPFDLMILAMFLVKTWPERETMSQ